MHIIDFTSTILRLSDSSNRCLGKFPNLLMQPRSTRNAMKLSSRRVVLTFPGSLTQMPWIR